MYLNKKLVFSHLFQLYTLKNLSNYQLQYLLGVLSSFFFNYYSGSLIYVPFPTSEKYIKVLLKIEFRPEW